MLHCVSAIIIVSRRRLKRVVLLYLISATSMNLSSIWSANSRKIMVNFLSSMN